MLIIINTVQDNIDNVLEVIAEDTEGFLPFSQSSNFTEIILFCEMASFYLCPFPLKQIVSTNKMINISNNLGTCQFIDSARTHFAKQ